MYLTKQNLQTGAKKHSDQVLELAEKSFEDFMTEFRKRMIDIQKLLIVWIQT